MLALLVVLCWEHIRHFMDKLKNTKCTVIGPMQFADGTQIREYFRSELSKIGVTVFDHYHNPFIDDCIKEDEQTVAHIKQLIKEERFDELEQYKSIRSHDLALIDKSDFIIVEYKSGVTMCGTWEEFFSANRMKKPIFFITNDKKLTPAWVYWTIPHRYVYTNKEDVVTMLNNINNGTIKIDSERWRLLKPEYR